MRVLGVILIAASAVAVAAAPLSPSQDQAAASGAVWAVNDGCERVPVTDLSIFWARLTRPSDANAAAPAPLFEVVPGATQGQLGFQQAFDGQKPLHPSGVYCAQGDSKSADVIGVHAFVRIDGDACFAGSVVLADQIVIGARADDVATATERTLLVNANDRADPIGLVHATGDGVGIVNPGGDVFQTSQLGWTRRQIANRKKGAERVSVLESAAEIQERHTPALLAIPDVVGTMVSLGPSSDIVVLTSAPLRAQDVNVPSTIEGVHVRFVEVGVLKALAHCAAR